MNFLKNRPVVAYACVFGWTLFIYVSVLFVRDFQKLVYRTIGKAAFVYFVLAVLSAGFLWSVLHLRKKQAKAINFVWLSGVALAYGYFTVKLWRFPAEAMHFVEYGVLSYLLYVALRHHVRDVTLYFSVAFIILFLGTVDEIIQWLVPERFWDFRDVGLNFLSGGLFQVALWKGFQPKNIVKKVTARSIQILSVAIAASLLLLGLCFSFTPPRIGWITEKLPFLSLLKENENMMSETGFKHMDPEFSAFYSRFRREDLVRMDKERQQEYAEVLNDTVDMKYTDFLKIYNPVAAPFLYEMRIHIFRRDRYERKGLRAQGVKRKEHLTVAYKENQILEKYFGETLRQSAYLWSEEKKEKIAKESNTDGSYESPVSKQLFTSFTEKAVWFAIGGVLVMLVIVNVFVSYRAHRSTEMG